PRQVSSVDYEAVGLSRQFTTFCGPLFFLPATERGERGPGGGHEPPGRRTEAATSWHGRQAMPAPAPTPSGCTRLFGLRPLAASRPSQPATPRRPFVRPSFRGVASPWDRPSCALTRLVPAA